MTDVVSSILGPLVEKLASSAVEEIQLVCGVKNDREKLQNKLNMIQEVLADAEQKQIKEKAVRRWLSELKHFCYDVEDVLDEFESRALWRRARLAERSTLKRKVRYWLSNFLFQFKMAHKMKELGKRLDGINEEKTKFNLSSNVQENTIIPRRETHSFVLTSNVIGRNEEKERITEFLLRSDDGGAGRIAVVPILGMGGAGKTTLAKLVYNDDRVNEHFKDNKVWLSMPVKFEVEKIVRDIIKSLGDKAKYDSCSLDELQKRLRNLVEDKRCLFVMDDVWEMSRDDWVELRDLLGGVSVGSKVIITSRNKSIAEIMGTVPPLDLAKLSQEDSLELFMKCAFDQGQEQNHPELMVIAKEIVSKCGGNPLAVKTLGRLLYSKKRNRSDWEYVRDSEMWKLQTPILPSLRISYDLMPSYLKQCFAYCSIFPKNHEFTDLDLINFGSPTGLSNPAEISRSRKRLDGSTWRSCCRDPSSML